MNIIQITDDNERTMRALSIINQFCISALDFDQEAARFMSNINHDEAASYDAVRWAQIGSASSKWVNSTHDARSVAFQMNVALIPTMSVKLISQDEIDAITNNLHETWDAAVTAWEAVDKEVARRR